MVAVYMLRMQASEGAQDGGLRRVCDARRWGLWVRAVAGFSAGWCLGVLFAALFGSPSAPVQAIFEPPPAPSSPLVALPSPHFGPQNPPPPKLFTIVSDRNH